MAESARQIATPATEAIRAARALVDNGDFAAALALLMRANRAANDVAIEKLLVQLRHDAFDASSRAAPAAIPPPISADASTPGPLPELEAAALTPATLRAGLRHQGCVLVRGLITPDRADALAGGIDRALDAFDAAVAGASEDETQPWYVPFAPKPGQYRVGGRRNWVRASGGVWTADSPRMLFELLDMIEATGIGAIVTEYLGERPALSANKCTLRRVPLTSNTDWHQDGAFLGTSVRTLNVWLSLSHCGRDVPGLDILPRRLDHLAETGTEGAFFDWSVAPPIVEQLSRDVPVLRPEFSPGDALLFDHMFLHRTAIGPEMTHERYAIETWFFAPSVYPDGQIPLLY